MENGSTSQRPGRRARTLWRWTYIALSGLLLLSASCSPSVTGPGADPEEDANYLKAKKLYELREYRAAAEFYRKLLLDHPRFAKAHLELGLLYDDKLSDPISAIYHYRCFLEITPHSNKRPLVEDFIERAKLSLAAKLPQSPIVDPSEVARLQNERAALIQENAALKAQLAELGKASVATASRSGAAAQPAAAVASTPVAASAAPVETAKPKVHVVQKGDTLQSLGLRYYGSRSAWEKIYVANRSILPNKDQLRIGQELVIP